VCYTGYTLEELRAQSESAFDALLAEIDLLIDGDYRMDLPAGGSYRASANQRLHFLTDRILPDACQPAVETDVRIGRGAAVVTGTLPQRVLDAFWARLRRAGIEQSPVVRSRGKQH
jgi:anaerobic ribonucleoside-triphosphate reductase activating protein